MWTFDSLVCNIHVHIVQYPWTHMYCGCLCHMWCPGPRVIVDNKTSVLEFGSVQCGHSSSAVLHLTNCSDIPTLFQVRELNVGGCWVVNGLSIILLKY